MAEYKIAVEEKAQSKEVLPRAKLTNHEIALLAELIKLYGMRGAAQRLAG